MPKTIIAASEEKMLKTIESLKKDFTKITHKTALIALVFCKQKAS